MTGSIIVVFLCVLMGTKKLHNCAPINMKLIIPPVDYSLDSEVKKTVSQILTVRDIFVVSLMKSWNPAPIIVPAVLKLNENVSQSFHLIHSVQLEEKDRKQ